MKFFRHTLPDSDKLDNEKDILKYFPVGSTVEDVSGRIYLVQGCGNRFCSQRDIREHKCKSKGWYLSVKEREYLVCRCIYNQFTGLINFRRISNGRIMEESTIPLEEPPTPQAN